MPCFNINSKKYMKKEIRPYKVFAIEEGTVIDHIKAGSALQIIRLLNLPSHSKIVTVGLNFKSKKGKLKDIVKVEKRELSEEEISRVAILAPDATINIVKNFKITKKFKAEIPELIEHVIVCPNPKCITNNERMETKFHVSRGKNNVRLKCNYCEKEFTQDEIKNYNS